MDLLQGGSQQGAVLGCLGLVEKVERLWVLERIVEEVLSLSTSIQHAGIHRMMDILI